MIYNGYDIQRGQLDDKVIWACAYSTNNTEKSMATRRKPVQGIIKDRKFYELNKKGEIKKSSAVSIYAREYTDTEQECIELYNKLAQRQIDFLKKLAEKCEADLINVEE